MKGLVAAVLAHKGLGKGWSVPESLSGEGGLLRPESSKALLGPEVRVKVWCGIRVHVGHCTAESTLWEFSTTSAEKNLID